MTGLDIVPVESRQDLRRFLALPRRIYAGDRFWVPPLDREVRKLLSPKNPFFDDGEAAYFLALRGGEAVGRISAQVNRRHLALHNDMTGNFGFLEAVDDQAVFDALLATAEDWLRVRGLRRAIGPYSLTINDDIGVLVSGFDSAPMALMGHSPRYYQQRLEQAGYAKAKDVLAFRLGREELGPGAVERMTRIRERFAANEHIALRLIDMKRFEEEMHLILSLYNDAWRDNWGFLPVTPKEARNLVASIKPFVRPDQVIVASVAGETIGFIAAIPDINEFFADLQGKLLPFGWAKVLWRLKFATPRGVRVILAGVKSEYRNSALSGAVMSSMLGMLVENLVRSRHQVCEISWILEDNLASIRVTRLFAKLAKTYRIYGKNLNGA